MFAKALVLFATLLVSGCADAKPKDTALRLEFDEGVCSATAVGVDLILSAEHCWTAGRLRKINGTPANALEIVKDGKDHALVRVNMKFKQWASMGPAPMQGDRLRWWGNAAGEPDLYREGYVARTTDEETFIDSHSFGGDSGSGLLDTQGRVVAVLSAGKLWRTANGFTFAMTVCYPLAFTAKHWQEIRA